MMKSVSLLIVSLFLTTTAHAAPLSNGFADILSQVSVNGVLQERQAARVQVDDTQKVITVDIYQDICGVMTALPGTITCKAAPVILKSYQVPFAKPSKDCGSDVYEGMRDQRPVDGLYVSITAVDNSFRVCKDIPEGLIVVDMKTIHPMSGGVTEYHLVK